MSYPPQISLVNLENLRDLAVDWALSHGLAYRPTVDIALPNNSSVMHAPFTLFPSQFPRKAFEHAISLQPLFNRLYHRLANDHLFIVDIMQELSKVDEFVAKLYNLYLTVHKEGISQPICLGIHRSDYLLHLPPDVTDAHILQVEINTISASFSSLSSLVGDLHRYLLDATNYCDFGIITHDVLPPNESMKSFAKGIAKAHELYGSQDAIVLMVVQPGERNAFDQRWIEYNLLQNHQIHIIRKSLVEILHQGKLDPDTKALYINGKEISVSYFRAAYGPDDFPSQKEWDARLLLERSKSIKCPTLAYHLVGAKKVQQILANPGVLERYTNNVSEAQMLRACFAGLYPLDSSPEGKAAVNLALKHPDRYVMKPQREGGGNNIYGADISATLSRLSPSERSSYILMDLIQPPPQSNILIRLGEIIRGETTSELGIYGIFIGKSGDYKEFLNETGGHLLRTKMKTTNEGGIAAGFAVIDSPLLV